MNEVFPQTASQYSTFKSRIRGSSNSTHHEENDPQVIERCQEQRRLSRLYGSKTRNLKKGKIKHEKDNDSTKQDITKMNKNDTKGELNSKKEKKVEKFFDRPTDELLVEIHSDNYNISHPWFVGYQNTTSLQGSPNALASRYGFNGAIQITKQCSNRQGDIGTLLDQSSCRKCTPKLAEVSRSPARSISSGGRNQHFLIPKSRQQQSRQPTQSPQPYFTASDKAGVNTKNLDRAIEREICVWENIITEAKGQRISSCNEKKRREVYKTKLTKHCARSIHMKHAGVKSHKVFLLS